jgi:hypothetical protein
MRGVTLGPYTTWLASWSMRSTAPLLEPPADPQPRPFEPVDDNPALVEPLPETP